MVERELVVNSQFNQKRWLFKVAFRHNCENLSSYRIRGPIRDPSLPPPLHYHVLEVNKTCTRACHEPWVAVNDDVTVVVWHLN